MSVLCGLVVTAELGHTATLTVSFSFFLKQTLFSGARRSQAPDDG
jgi:hypothetical protein